MHRLDEVVDTLLVLQKKHRIRFDVWQVVKRDHAIISFFDQGMNPAVPRVAYWTPFRYPLLLNLASLFDNELAEKAWCARLEAHDGRSSSLFSEVCSELLARVHTLGDRRYIEWHCCKVSDEAAFCLIQRPYISKTLLTRRISPRGSP